MSSTSTMPFSKVKRSANYTIQEKEEILRIVSKYPIIENKQTDGANVKEKNVAWDNITKEYNSLGFTQRNVKNLKHAYDNWKRKVRTSIADNKVTAYLQDSQGGSSREVNCIEAAIAARRQDKQELKRTGGGSYTPHQREHQALMLANISSEQFEPLPNNYDLDIGYHQSNINLHQDRRDEENYSFEDEELPDSASANNLNSRPTENNTNKKSFRSTISNIKGKTVRDLEKKLEDDDRQKYYRYKLEAAKRKAELEEKLLNLNIELVELNIARAKQNLANVN